MAVRGVPHDVLCPQGQCGHRSTSLECAAMHYCRAHAAICVVCGTDAENVDEDHIKVCTLSIAQVCPGCQEEYEVRHER